MKTAFTCNPTRLRRPAGRVVLLVLSLPLVFSAATAAIRTPRKPVTTDYHGVKVTEDYRWLEAATNAAVQRWSAAQNRQARAFLDQLPARPWVEDRLTRLLTAVSPDYSAASWRADQFFFLKFQPPAQQPVLVTLSSLADLNTERVILDPNTLSPDHTTAIDWYVPSHDGKLVAVSLSEKGSEHGTLYIYETATGRRRPDIVPRVQGPTAGGSAAWNADNSGLFYTRYPHPGERPEADLSFFQQVHFHKLGTPAAQDTYELGKEFPRIAEIELEASPDGRRVLATVSDGDGGDYAHYLREPSGRWRQITRFEDQVKHAEFGRDPLYLELGKDDALYLLSRRDAPKGKILRLPFAAADLSQATVFYPESTNVIQTFKPSASGLALVLMNGGPSRFAFYDFLDQELYEPRERDRTVATVQQVLVTRGDEMLFRTVTYTQPYAWSRYNPNRGRERLESTPLAGKSPVSFGDVEIVRAAAESQDSTRVPLTILRRKGTRLTGDNPTILYGYGGYGISVTPNFDVSRRLWLDQGGVFAIAHLRGGGEFGEDWHRAGNLTRKQNVFDDFAACAQWLIRSNYTNPAKLAIEGRSNGGLLMGAALTQHPELFRAVVSHVGIYDMLRVELDPNGAFNVTEFGSVKDPDQFRALFGYSPYHRVRDGVAYPAVLLLTGEHDGRVNPAHSRKLTARLQAATSSRRPVLLRTSSHTGHGAGTALDERIQQLADVYAFLLDQLGVEYSLVDRGPWSGGVTPTAATVKAKLAREGLSARLAVSKSPLLRRARYSERVRAESNAYDLVTFRLTDLEPDTQYYYALEVDGRLQRRHRGAFRTFPPADRPASFTMAFASCGRTGSTRDVFDRIREHRPLFYLNMGDFHYSDIRTNDRALFRAAYDAVLASPQQGDLYREVPFVYVWDDHDFGGNNASGSSRTHEAARLAYEEYVPHYPLAFPHWGDALAFSFSVGRVKFIVTDLRSQRDDARKTDDANKSMMGGPQKEWFKRELLAAKGKYPLICWVSSDPWLGEPRTNYYHWVPTNHFGFIHHTNHPGGSSSRADRRVDDDHWSVFATERREIADFIKANRIAGVALLHGDAHMLAADDGSHSDFATGGGAPIPVMGAAPLDQNPSIKGGLYSQGVYRVNDRAGESGFGLLTVKDHGDRIDVAFSGRNNRDEEKISLRFTVPAAPDTGNNGRVAGRGP